MIPPFQPPFGDGNRNNDRRNQNFGMPFEGQRNVNQPPSGPPPRQTPNRPMNARGGASTFAVDPGAIRNCLFRNTYIWLDNGQEFWLFPIQVGRHSVSGFRWIPRRGWVFTGISLNRIDFFTCVI